MSAKTVSTTYTSTSLMLSHIEVLVGRGVQFAVAPETVAAPPGAPIKMVGGCRWVVTTMEPNEQPSPERVA
jgi:hypothetical protein